MFPRNSSMLNTTAGCSFTLSISLGGGFSVLVVVGELCARRSVFFFRTKELQLTQCRVRDIFTAAFFFFVPAFRILWNNFQILVKRKKTIQTLTCCCCETPTEGGGETSSRVKNFSLFVTLSREGAKHQESLLSQNLEIVARDRDWCILPGSSFVLVVSTYWLLESSESSESRGGLLL